MNIQRFFIRKIQENFAIVVSTTDRKEVVLEAGALPLIRGKFINYVKNRDSLIEAFNEKITA